MRKKLPFVLLTVCSADNCNYQSILIVELEFKGDKQQISIPSKLSETELYTLLSRLMLSSSVNEMKSVEQRYLLNEIAEIQYAIDMLDSCLIDYSLADVIRLYHLNKEPFLFDSFYKKSIKTISGKLKLADMNCYASLLKEMYKFQNSTRPFRLSEIDCRWLDAFRYHLLLSGFTKLEIDTYWLILCEVYHQASVQGVCSQLNNPFAQSVELPILPDGLYSLTEAELDKIRLVDLSGNCKLSLIRDFYLLEFYYVRRITFIDLINLKRTDVYNDKIWFRRYDDGRLCSLSVSGPVKFIIDRYEGHSEYLFPLPAISNPMRMQYDVLLRWYNSQLRKLATYLDFSPWRKLIQMHV